MLETNLEKTENEIKKIISNFLDISKYRIFIFGSRANKKSNKYSDFDIGILGAKPIPWHKLVSIEEDLEYSDIPYKVDIVDFSLVSPEFKKIALSQIKNL